MKNLKSILSILAICAVTISTSYANTKHLPSKKSNNIRTEIISILGTEVPFAIDETSTATIVFTINDENEVLIISVDSENKEFSSYAKSKLHKRKLDSTMPKARTLYTIPVQIQNKG